MRGGGVTMGRASSRAAASKGVPADGTAAGQGRSVQCCPTESGPSLILVRACLPSLFNQEGAGSQGRRGCSRLGAAALAESASALEPASAWQCLPESAVLGSRAASAGRPRGHTWRLALRLGGPHFWPGNCLRSSMQQAFSSLQQALESPSQPSPHSSPSPHCSQVSALRT